jgi:exopolysaccharide biosynthesis polyprenyl glycosylphosphotransferase
MLRRQRQLRMQIHQWIDGALFAIALWLAHGLRYNWKIQVNVAGLNILGDPIKAFAQGYFWLFLVIIPMAPLVLEWQGFYKRPVFATRREMTWPLFKSCLFCTIGLILVLYMLRFEAARGVIVLFGCFSFALVWFKEELVRWAYKSKLGQAQFKKRIVLVGAKQDTTRLRAEIGKAQDELEILAEFDLNETSIQQLVDFLHERAVNGVILNAKHTYFGQVEKAIQACELEGIEAWLVADFFQTKISQTSLDDFYGRPVLVFHSGPVHSGPGSAWRSLIKQVIDFLGAAVLLILSAPFLLGAAIAIKLTAPGPIFFRHQRSGLNGKPFSMFKFRTMVTNAEQLKQELAVLNEMSGPVFKITHDPRVTPIGHWLRKFSVDEFPQLLNVMRGEMSLVGPRPLPVDEVARFDDLAHRRRLSVKPGLTCLWQVSGRNNVSDFKDWVRLDLEYIDNWSLWLDIKILWRTIPVVLFAKGAK